MYDISVRWNDDSQCWQANIREKPGNFLAAIVTGTTEAEVNEKACEWLVSEAKRLILDAIANDPRSPAEIAESLREDARVLESFAKTCE
jgi:hypothetical protein